MLCLTLVIAFCWGLFEQNIAIITKRWPQIALIIKQTSFEHLKAKLVTGMIAVDTAFKGLAYNEIASDILVSVDEKIKPAYLPVLNSSQMQQTLGLALQAQENQDWLGLADYLEYEVVVLIHS